MQKAYHTRQSRPRLLVDELDPLGARSFEFARDVLSLEAYVMESATTAAEEFADAVVVIKRFEQFNFAVADLEQRRPNALVLDRRAFRQGQPEQVAPQAHRLFQVGHDNAYVMNPLEHFNLRCGRGRACAATTSIVPSSRACRGWDARCG